MKKVFLSVVAFVVIYMATAALLYQAKAVSVNDYDQFSKYIESDSTVIENVELTPVGEMLLDGKKVDYQLVKYTETKDSTVTEKTVFLKVKKGFLKYSVEGVLDVK